MSKIAFYSYQNGYMHLNPEGGYMIPMDTGYLGYLMNAGLFSNEVNVINGALNSFQNTDKDFIDIGANVGVYSLVLGQVFNKVYAFEPDKHIFNCLCGNIAIHNLSDVIEAFNVGLYSKEADLYFNYTDMMGSNNFFEVEDDDTNKSLAYQLSCGSTKLHVKPLDSYHFDNVGLIKIDTEGTELQVLQGATETIVKNGYPPIIFESWNPEDRSKSTNTPVEYLEKLRKDLFEYIQSFGYTIEHLENDVFLARY